MEWYEDLPEVTDWTPVSGHEENLSNGLLLTCQAAQSRIVAEAQIERKFNVNNFDSGLGVEDIVRQEISKLLPDRYSVDAGVVNDQDGKTAGDYDVLIRNKFWAPATKLGTTPASRRFHFPVDAIYSAMEVKQTLGLRTLDSAMEKLVKVARLNRPENPYGHITENQHLSSFDRVGHLLNPLHTAVLGTRLDDDTTFLEIARRFEAINAGLSRNDMVKELCVLDHGLACYMVNPGNTGWVEATFMWDREEFLTMAIYDNEPHSVLGILMAHLLGHLTRSVLRVHDLHRRYRNFRPTSKFLLAKNALFNSGVVYPGELQMFLQA